MRRRFVNSHNAFDYSKYMTIEALEDGYEVYFRRDVEYNLNGHKWVSLKANMLSPILKKGDLLSLRCSSTPGEVFGAMFGNNKAINLRGNILSLIFKDDANLDISSYDNVFNGIFSFHFGNNIVSVEKNFLPATSRQFPSNPWNSGEWGQTLWAGKRYWKSGSNDKKNEQTKTWHICFIQ